MKNLFKIGLMAAFLGGLTLALPHTSQATSLHPGVSNIVCSSLNNVSRPSVNYEQRGTCYQPGPGGFIGSWGVGIAIQFGRPEGMSQDRFNSLLRSSNLKALCAEAHILPGNVPLPEGMTAAQFEQANRDGQLSLSPCVKPHMHFPI